MQIVYGTRNRAKLDAMRHYLAGLDLEIVGLDAIDEDCPDVEEDGQSPLDNARVKARAYYQVLRRPVFSVDSGLYFDGVSEALQPGVNVRRVVGRRLDDDEMIEHYAALAREHGGELRARYRNGICLALGVDRLLGHMGEDIAGAAFILRAQPHPKRIAGFPLDTLSVHILSGKYYYDLPDDGKGAGDEWEIGSGFRSFFQSVLSSL
jgi:8-oxo-dGTP diphosphatase